MGNLESSRNITFAPKPKGLDILPLQERETLLSLRARYPLLRNPTSKLTTVLTSWVTKQQHLFKLLPLTFRPLQENIQKFSLHASSQQTSHQRITWPTDFHTQIALQYSFWGERTTECNQFTFLNEHSTAWNIIRMWQWQQRGHEAAWDHSWKLGWVGKHLVPTSAVPSGFQLGKWH